MQKSNITLSLMMAGLFMMASCEDKEVVPIENVEEEVVEQVTVATTLNALTGGDVKVWKLQQATLFNAGNASGLNVTNLFNIKDDEFVFHAKGGSNASNGDGLLVWYPGYQLQADAADLQHALTDKYGSPQSFTFDIVDDKPETIVTTEGSFALVLQGKTSVTGSLQLGDNKRLELSLIAKEASDYKKPANLLSFSPLANLSGVSIASGSAGLLASHRWNSLYFATRDRTATSNSVEKIQQYSLATTEFTTSLFIKNDFVSKEVQFIDGNLVIIGGQFVNTYTPGLAPEPQSVTHGLKLTRHGSATVNNDLFVFGGDLDEMTGDKMYRWNSSSASFTEIATMPAPRYYADGEIVHDKLYIFGGHSSFNNITPSEQTIFVYDLKTNSWKTTLQMPVALSNTFTARYGNLIYVGGYIEVDADADGRAESREPYIGAFNVLDGSFTKVSTNLSATDMNRILQLTILDDKVYIIYEIFTGTNYEYSLQVANL